MRELCRVVALLSVVLIFTSVDLPAQQPTPQVEGQQLEQHKPIERALAAKETHAYTIALDAGQNYYAAGFSFNHGSFQSREAQPKDPKNRMLMSFTVGPASVDSVDWFLAQTGAKISFVDFRSSRKSAEIGEWLAAPHPMRSVGSMYAAGSEQSYFSPITLDKEFDGLFFVDTANRARPNPSVINVAKPQ